MFYLRIALAAVVVAIWVADFIIAKATGAELTSEYSYLLSIVLGGVFGGEIRDAIKRRGRGGDGDA